MLIFNAEFTIYKRNLLLKGSRVWIPDKEEVWKCAQVKVDFKAEHKKLTVEDEEGNTTELAVENIQKLPSLRNPDILIGANDLTSLSYLHEPAVLYNLRVRFLDQCAIYTWCGIVLVAINPFEDLDIYGDETIKTYHQSTGSAQLDPHIYAVAEDAYSKLERENFNQSIIVSGESGAGKTVSAKFAMRYFASIAGSHSTNIENRVLASNPIMEAIGNAKTTRNDNSSRFGKYIQIMFDPQSRSIIGGNMRTYLLEKSRISKQAENERNFHIFYQICNFCQQKDFNYLRLKKNYAFNYLGDMKPSSADDISKFNEAMTCLGFSDKQQDIIYRIVAAVLHAGNIEFVPVDEEQCEIYSNDEHLSSFCELLGLDSTATKKWLTCKVLRTGMREVITTPVNIDTAQYGRDALAKYIYEKMFLWVVALINKSLGTTASSQSSTFIGVLDIYGFEHFEHNSFEQFCINYANEVLQQQFNQHVFKLEQEEYVREGIDWQFITFTDNQPVIDLIEAKPIGILNLLDEECKMPRGTDETWGAKLYSQLTVGEIFQKPKFGFQSSFIIQHFADKVVYEVDGFLEKNRDTVWEEQIDLLKRSNIVDSVFSDDPLSDSQPQKSGGKIKITAQQQQKQQKIAKATVGSQFRESLAALMRTLNATTPHYIRCIKPNDNKAAFEFNNNRAVQQLRACGVLETIRISSNGFPSRWTYTDFANRYRVLLVGMYRKGRLEKRGSVSNELPRKLVRAGSSATSEVKAICLDVIKLVYELGAYSQFKHPGETQKEEKLKQIYQLGKTKLFFRSGQVALLERIRAQKLRDCAVLLQRMVRGWLQRRRYTKIKATILRLQSYSRGFLARKRFWHMKCTKAATRIQTKWRSYIARKKYLRLKQTAISIQKYGRGLLARRNFVAMKRNRAAITIQRYYRGFTCRKNYKKQRRNIVIIQNLVRRRIAKKILKQLKVEAKSVEHVKALNKGLERKIIELQQKVDVLNDECNKRKQFESNSEEFKNESIKLSTELKNAKNIIIEKDQLINDLRSRVDEMDNKNKELLIKLEDQISTIDKLKVETEKVQEQVDVKATEEALAAKEQQLIAKYERERKILLEERESEKSSHQQLLRKYAALEDKLQSGADFNEDENRNPDISTVSLMMRCSEMEQECAKLKHENQEMRDAFANLADKNESDSAAALLAQQCALLQNELDRVREERSNLKTIVLGQESAIRDQSAEAEVISAFKSIIKQLEREVEREKDSKEQLMTELNALKKDNDRQQQMIAIGNNAVNPKDATFMKLSQEKMLLQEKCTKLSTQVNELKIKLMRRKVLGESKFSFVRTSVHCFCIDDENEIVDEAFDPQNKNLLGMFEYSPQSESLILRILISGINKNSCQKLLSKLKLSDLEPTIALKFPPHFPAYIIFMCIRYTDYVNDDNQVRSLLNNAIMAIKRTIKRNHNYEIFVLWLSNTCKLITCLKQYSGDELFGVFDESLKNFDLSEYRQIFSDVAVWIYQGVIKQSEERIQPLIVPAVLEFEGLASSGIYSQPATIQRSGSISGEDSVPSSPTEKPVDALIKELSYLHKVLLLHVVEPELINQIFKQCKFKKLFYFICAGALNNLLLRKDLCHWNKAMQIRFNLSALEQWCREQQIPKWSEVVEKLDPIIQATKLLQTKKTEEHIATIVEMCNKLSSSQIMKILNLYTAGEEENISHTFIKRVQLYLSEHRREGPNPTLLMDTKYVYAITIPYNPSDVSLKSVSIPPVLLKKGLGTVLRRL
ncbi:unconventional myosin-Va-like protein [Leptotrombidium deliense]|uniref:Unconventional myosin-Va-like protein n=1 Tax=Leptotrombidium deliense TaxID=299467 RepID=A0A443SK46_9ACAR|nr:unconventional myosin-Va-like protein [Leptotrombidium deliense]